MQDHDETVSNTSTNPCFTQILVERLSRRRLLQDGLSEVAEVVGEKFFR